MMMGVNKYGIRSLLLTALLAASTLVAAQDGDARDLVKKVLDALPKVPFKAQLNVTTPQGVRVVELDHKFVNGARGSYLELMSPEDLKGIRFLFLERVDAPSEQYMKVAASHAVVKVADEVRKQPFIGSTFYIADLIEPPIDNFTYKFVGEDQILGRKVMLVEATPKNPAKEIYSKTILALDPKDLLVLRRQFYDQKGQIQKVWTVEKVEKIDGNWTLTEQRMTNSQTNDQSRLEVKDVKYNVDLPDTMFTPKYLMH